MYESGQVPCGFGGIVVWIKMGVIKWFILEGEI